MTQSQLRQLTEKSAIGKVETAEVVTLTNQVGKMKLTLNTSKIPANLIKFGNNQVNLNNKAVKFHPLPKDKNTTTDRTPS
jgi:hypothetical protein